MARRKANDRRALLVDMTDKVTSRDMVSLALKPLIYTGDIDNMPEYPGYCVVKPNNNSGKTYHCRSEADYQCAIAKMQKLQYVKYGQEKGEWAYSRVPFKVMVEEMIDPGIELSLFCFHGVCRFIRLFGYSEDKQYRMSHFDRDGKFINVRNTKYKLHAKELPAFDRGIIDIVESQAAIDHVRTDINISDKVYFGEFTLYSGSGTMTWNPADFDIELGKWWDI